ncbi:MAG: hypothetical protein RL748_680 [Pseudomonadota bacterium]|jgi:tetratricopeptide (TPR) repeat protein
MTAIPPPAPAQAELAARLQRLQGYLLQDPDNTHLLLDLIDLCLALGLWQNAQPYLEHARQLAPHDPYFQQRQASVWMAQENWAAANAVLESLYRDMPDLILAHDLAITRFRLGQYAAAQACLQACLAQPSVPLASVILMLRCLHHGGDLKSALALVQPYEVAAETSAEFWSVVSLLQLDADNLPQAERCCRHALALAQDKTVLEALIVSGTLALGHADLTLAQQHFEQALQIKPDEGRIWGGKGLIKLMQQDWIAASADLEQAVIFMPRHIGTRHVLAWCKILAGDLASARAILNAALAMDRNFGETHGGLAVVAAMSGQTAEAQVLVRRSLGLNPQGMAARFAQTLLARQGNSPADLARFQQEVAALLASQSSPFGGSLTDLMQKMRP